jgi:TonB family protein
MLASVLALAAGPAVVAQTAPPEKPAPVITNPNWLRKPTQEEMLSVWPAEAARRGIGGRATIACTVNISGTLQGCKPVSEDPPGSGFGDAAVLLAGAFKMKPQLVDGKAVAGASVRIPIIFIANGPMSGKTRPAVSLPVWSRAPSFADMDAAWPKGAGDLKEGGATLRCSVSSTGALRNCQRMNEMPRGKGFGSAAMDLADRFEMMVGPGELEKVKGGLVNVPFRFLNPASPEARRIGKLRWIVQLKQDRVLALYPDKAADAGVKTGTGVADCLVAPDGKLTDCKTARETPEGLGFGDAAVAVAGVMQMNPWTDDGRPVDGLRIKLPINFTQAEETAAKAKP